MLASTRFRKRNMSLVRAETLTRRHESNAVLAAATAALTSPTEAKPSSAVFSPVAGLNTGLVRPDVAATLIPFMRWLICFMVLECCK